MDLFGLPSATNITAAIMSLGTLTDGKIATAPVLKASTPFYRIIGTESSFQDLRVIENAGALNLDKNTGTEAVPVWTRRAMLGAGTYACRRNRSTNNAATPTTQFDLQADWVTLRSTDHGLAVVNAQTAVTNNILTAGVTANGRDQAGAFSANSWVYFYWIYDGTTLASVSSVAAPDVGPTLPTGYTHWAYCGAVRAAAAASLRTTYFRGSWAYLTQRVSLLSAGVAAVETSIGLASVVPPEAEAFLLEFQMSGNQNATLRVISGSDYTILPAGTFGGHLTLWNNAQTMYYLFAAAPTGSLSLLSLGYQVSNGGE